MWLNKKEVGMNIKQARKKKGLKQRELADMIGFSESSISKYEQGLISIPPTVLERLSKVLEVPLSDLCSWDDEFNADGKLAQDVNEYENFKNYLVAIGYFMKGDEISVEIKNNSVKATFTQEEFKALQQQSRANIDGAILLQSQKNKKEPPSAATENDSEDNG